MLCCKLSSGVHIDLHDLMEKEQVKDLPFKEWLKRMRILDQACLRHNADIAEEAT